MIVILVLFTILSLLLSLGAFKQVILKVIDLLPPSKLSDEQLDLDIGDLRLARERFSTNSFNFHLSCQSLHGGT